jgi:ATP-dependent Clp protease ATP-binding subunit ClpB
MLKGPAGSGKTTVIKSLAQKIASGNCPDSIKHKRIYHLDIDSIMNDPFNSLHRVLVLVNEMNDATAPDAIIFIDEAHRLNDRVNGMKLADLLKPFLELRYIHVIAATTDEECEELYQDKAIQRRFTTVSMPVPSDEDIAAMIKIKFDQLPVELRPTDEAIQEAMRQAKKLFPSIALPDSGIKVLRSTLNWKRYHQNDQTPITDQNIKDAIDGGYIEKEPAPLPSPEKRIADALEFWKSQQKEPLEE